jgi:hypothetical protein
MKAFGQINCIKKMKEIKEKAFGLTAKKIKA